MKIRKRIKNKNKTFLDNLMKAFLKQGHTWETFSYLRKENLLKEKREKVKNFRKRTFLEKPVRVQRESFNLIKKRIKDSGDIFYTDFSMEEEKSWVDLFFLSKKYPNVFYNVEIISSDCHVLDALEQLSFDYCFDEKEKLFGFKIDKLSEDEKQKLFEELSKTQTNTSYQIHRDYVFGIGLHIKLNNGKKTFTKDEITKVINDFWENNEVEIEPNYKKIEVDSEEMKEILYNFYKMCYFRKQHVVKDKIFSFFKKKSFSKEEVDLADQKIIKDYFENRNHLRMRKKLYSEIFNDLEYQRIVELVEQKEKEIAPQNKEELKKRLSIQIIEKNKKINFEDLFINILALLEKDQEKIEKYLDEVLKELSK